MKKIFDAETELGVLNFIFENVQNSGQSETEKYIISGCLTLLLFFDITKHLYYIDRLLNVSVENFKLEGVNYEEMKNKVLTQFPELLNQENYDII